MTYSLLVERTNPDHWTLPDRTGLTLTTGYPTMDDARQAGESWQAENGDNPCWNAFNLHTTDGKPNLIIVHPYYNRHYTKPGSVSSGLMVTIDGAYVRYIDRMGSTDMVRAVMVYGPFATEAEAVAFGQGRASATDSCEWQVISEITNHDQFIHTTVESLEPVV